MLTATEPEYIVNASPKLSPCINNPPLINEPPFDALTTNLALIVWSPTNVLLPVVANPKTFNPADEDIIPDGNPIYCDALITDAVIAFSTNKLPLPAAPPNAIISTPLNLAKPFNNNPEDVIGTLL